MKSIESSLSICPTKSSLFDRLRLARIISTGSQMWLIAVTHHTVLWIVTALEANTDSGSGIDLMGNNNLNNVWNCRWDKVVPSSTVLSGFRRQRVSSIYHLCLSVSIPFSHPLLSSSFPPWFSAPTSASDFLLLGHDSLPELLCIIKLFKTINRSFISFCYSPELIPAIMFSLLTFGFICLASFAQAQMDTGCGVILPTSTTTSPATISSCTLFYTPSMPPQVSPTITVYATTMTTQFNVVNCNYCQVSNIVDNPVPTVGVELILLFEVVC